MSLQLRTIGLLATATLVAICACDSADDVLAPPLEVIGVWMIQTVELADTCDEVASAELIPRMLIELETEFDYGDYRVRFDDVDPRGWCWVAPFSHTSDDVIRWDFGVSRYAHSCNPGCEVGTESWIELTFAPGGTFSGVERTTYTRETPECDVPACDVPCVAGTGHVIFGELRHCANACETRYAWSGVTIAPPDDKTCR